MDTLRHFDVVFVVSLDLNLLNSLKMARATDRQLRKALTKYMVKPTKLFVIPINWLQC